MIRTAVAAVLLIFCEVAPEAVNGAESLKIATFQIDVTPPIGSPLCLGLVPPASKIDDPLFVRGIVLSGAEQPIVLCSADLIGIGNSGYDAWRETLARAAGTDQHRVAISCIHQHDAPGCDFDAEELMVAQGVGGKSNDVPYLRDVLKRLEAAVKNSMASSRPVTHLGMGKARVDRVASNRRILGADGMVKTIRWSSTKDPDAISAPEGTIDPMMKLLSFWNNEIPLVSVTFYATHPQSHYGKGAVSADVPGLARARRDREEPDLFHIHFNGAGGNVTAGKYNDGSPEARVELTSRFAEGMRNAWKDTQRTPISAADVQWRVQPVILPLRDRLQDLTKLESILTSDKSNVDQRNKAAMDLAFARRMTAGKPIDLTALHIGPAIILNLPGEIFIEYQLAAQQMRPEKFVCTSGYGDYGPGYIGTAISYTQGGYETGDPSRTDPAVEEVLLTAIRKLMQ